MRAVFANHALARAGLSLSIAMLAGTLLVLGCGSGESDAPKEPRVARKDRQPNPNRIRAELRQTVDLPESYPQDAPIYPGATTNNSGLRYGRVTAVFSSEDPTGQVAEYVRAKLGTEGWNEISIEEMPNGSVLHGKKGEREISVLVSNMDEGTEYELTIMVVAVDP